MFFGFLFYIFYTHTCLLIILYAQPGWLNFEGWRWKKQHVCVCTDLIGGTRGRTSLISKGLASVDAAVAELHQNNGVARFWMMRSAHHKTSGERAYFSERLMILHSITMHSACFAISDFFDWNQYVHTYLHIYYIHICVV